jgi:hypothetical protein
MQTTPTLAAARQIVHDALEAGDQATLEDFADYAAEELNTSHIAALVLSLLQEGPQSRITKIIGAVEVVRHEVERKRAAFIEYQAAFMFKQAVQAINQQQDLHAELDKAQ